MPRPVWQRLLEQGQSADYQIAEGRRVYLVPASGQIEVNGVTVSAGDGVAGAMRHG